VIVTQIGRNKTIFSNIGQSKAPYMKICILWLVFDMEAGYVLRDLLTKIWVTVNGLNIKIYYDWFYIPRLQYVDADEMSILIDCKAIVKIQRCFVMCVVKML
jgi:hypothetical protein